SKPAFAPRTPAIHAGASATLPPSYSSGYSPVCQTFPLSSCAKNASSASTSSPSVKSRSQTTTFRTPATSLTRSVTMNTSRFFPSVDDPKEWYAVPGTGGGHLLSPVAEWGRCAGSKGTPATALGPGSPPWAAVTASTAAATPARSARFTSDRRRGDGDHVR